MKFLRSNLQNPFQKDCKNLINFKNPKHFPKTPICRSKDMKMHENEGFRHIPSEETLDLGQKHLEDEVWSE